VPESRALVKGSDERRKKTMKVEKTQMYFYVSLAQRDGRQR